MLFIQQNEKLLYKAEDGVPILEIFLAAKDTRDVLIIRGISLFYT